MPSGVWNASTWDGHYDWSQRGEEWSAAWGNSEAQWFGSLYPRIHRFLPAGRVLEIAPGFGRWTRFLVAVSREFVGVDLSAKCIAHLRERFANSAVTFLQNDGLSLDCLEDRSSFDFVFSFDSLVHVEMDVVSAYVRQVIPRLASDGVVFFHHSNWAANDVQEENLHYRAESVSAEAVRGEIANAGGRVLVQELINWGGHGLSDCLTLFGRETGAHPPPCILVNKDWMEEARIIRTAHSNYAALG